MDYTTGAARREARRPAHPSARGGRQGASAESGAEKCPAGDVDPHAPWCSADGDRRTAGYVSAHCFAGRQGPDRHDRPNSEEHAAHSGGGAREPKLSCWTAAPSSAGAGGGAVNYGRGEHGTASMNVQILVLPGGRLVRASAPTRLHARRGDPGRIRADLHRHLHALRIQNHILNNLPQSSHPLSSNRRGITEESPAPVHADIFDDRLGTAQRRPRMRSWDSSSVGPGRKKIQRNTSGDPSCAYLGADMRSPANSSRSFQEISGGYSVNQDSPSFPERGRSQSWRTSSS